MTATRVEIGVALDVTDSAALWQQYRATHTQSFDGDEGLVDALLQMVEGLVGDIPGVVVRSASGGRPLFGDEDTA